MSSYGLKRYVPSRSPVGLPDGSEKMLAELARPHVGSFDFLLEEGLSLAVSDIAPREFRLKEDGPVYRMWIESAEIGFPSKKEEGGDSRLFPRECRERGLTYGGPLVVNLRRQIGDGPEERIRKVFSKVPIMLKSKRCRLRDLTPKQLAEAGEDASEFGGYFICNGIERVIRMLQIPRRNHIMALTRVSFANRGPMYTDKAVQVRCARPDQSSVSLTLHYLKNGDATLRFSLRKQEFFVPLIIVLKALRPTTDREIYERVMAGDHSNTYLSDRMEVVLQSGKGRGLKSSRDYRAYLGSRFRAILDLPETATDEEAGRMLLQRFILVHLNSEEDKFAFLILMLRKLYAFTAGKVAGDNPDAVCNHELLLSGHFYLMFLKEKLAELLASTEELLKRDVRLKRGGDPYAQTTFKKALDKQADVGRKVYYLLATGNLVSTTGLDQMQVAGYTVVADRVNYMRFLTHFRSVHRGAYFAEMKTTAVRKLLPESFGFLCPVHTPDGAPCGLLNHLAAKATVVTHNTPHALHRLPELLAALGMTPSAGTGLIPPHDQLPITVDGRIIGYAPINIAVRIVHALRLLKVEGYRRTEAAAKLEAWETTREQVKARLKQQKKVDDAEGIERAQKLRVDEETLKRVAFAGLDVLSMERRLLGSNQKAYPELPEGADQFLDSKTDVKDTLNMTEVEIRRALLAVPSTLEVAFIPPAGWIQQQEEALVNTLSKVSGGKDTGKKQKKKGRRDSTGAEDMDLLRDGPEVTSSDTCIGPFPGIFLQTQPARLIRPVKHLENGGIEVIGPMEQLYLEIACTPDDASEIARRHLGGIHSYSHMELSPMNMLSLAASLTPFSELNQSPRNMYQCQMMKQTMGMPTHALKHRSDTKLFRIQSPQVPIVQNQAQKEYGIDEYPLGTNAVVAVISYTGFDMEDAMIVNKSSYERGFGHGSVYKVQTVDLGKDRKAGEPIRYCFRNLQHSRDTSGQVQMKKVVETLDEDGFPPVGTLLKQGDPVYTVLDMVTNKVRIAKHKDSEPAYVEEIRLLGNDGVKAGILQKVAIKFRYNRNPVVGDKFSSRHGQKGVLSILWPQEDMPFSESGISPDVIINPHAFPSRMTIGMLVESMAGKSGSLYGKFQDSTPFRFLERQKAVDYFAEQLLKAGYSYYGSEPMYSGIYGTELQTHIFLGVVYYQRLRHMVSDKSQVRATGKINAITQQPVKGRKHGGGIRVGEMERDSLISHGTTFLLRDRLMNSSDRHVTWVCRKCGSLLSPVESPKKLLKGPSTEGDDVFTDASSTTRTQRRAWCLNCHENSCTRVVVPFVFRYLLNELAGMNIRVKLGVQDAGYSQ